VPYRETRGNWSQREQRRGHKFKDQHGREYFATVELKTGAPCGLIEMLFTAPLMPERTYMEIVEERPYDLFINYDRWLADIRTNRSDWEKEGRSRSRKIYGTEYDASKPFTAEVLEIIGPPPQPIEPVLAAKQGNKWILGFTNKVDPRLIEFFEQTSEEEELDFSDDDFSDLDDQFDPGAAAHGRAVNPRAEKPLPRAVAKGTGANKGKRRDGAGKFVKGDAQPTAT
jgi:hypothetical protein